jgi:hypothetical protein
MVIDQVIQLGIVPRIWAGSSLLEVKSIPALLFSAVVLGMSQLGQESLSWI